MGRLRPSVDARPALREHVERGRRDRAELVVGAGEVEMDLGGVVARADVGVDAAQLRGRREVAPAVVVDGVGVDVGRPVAVLVSHLGAGLAAAVGADHRLDFLALVGEAVLHLDGERAADGVEAEDRVVGHQRELADRHLRDEVPVDDVAIGFVDAHAVLVDREPLRRALHRRRDEAAVVDVALERVAGLVADEHPREALAQRLEEARRPVVAGSPPR